MAMTARKKLLTSSLFFASAMLCMIGIIKSNIPNIIGSVCGVFIAVCCMKDGK